MNISISKICCCIYLVFIISFLSSCTSLQRHGSSHFEGIVRVVEQYGQSKEMAINTTYFVKNDHIRMESTRAWQDEIVTVTLYDYDQRKMYTLLPEKKIFMEGSLPEENELTETAVNDDPDYKVRQMKAKTGIKKRILGFTCEQWIFKNNLEGELEMWMAKDFPLLEGALGRKSDFSASSGTFMSPFQMVIRKLDGQEVMRWEITDIKSRRLEDSIFVPPADYKKINRKIPSGK